MKISQFFVFASIILYCSSCISHKKTDIKVHDFTLNIEFTPALFRTGLCVIQKDGLNNTMSLDFIYKRKDRIPEDTIKPKIQNTAYLTTFNSDYTGDTLLIDSVETITLEKGKIENFIKTLHTDLITQNDVNIDWIGIDGYAIRINYKSDSINRSFTYRTLSPNDTTQYRLLRKIVLFMDENLKTKISKMYTKTWKEILKR